ncbi:MAG TPA: CsbD family protein [Stellaceae bacterium]|jgi:uncharacterized protein YjbJ (UPF0337 family)|nr:CsbD family protein [Stellaceae bacterium]
MDKDRIIGGVKKVTGAIKEGVGRATNDPAAIAEGRQEQSKGRVQGAIGKIKDAAREIAGKK